MTTQAQRRAKRRKDVEHYYDDVWIKTNAVREAMRSAVIVDIDVSGLTEKIKTLARIFRND